MNGIYLYDNKEWRLAKMHLCWSVGHEDHGQRAVDVLIRRTDMSRSMAKKIRLYRRLTCNGREHRMIDPVYTGDQLVAIYQANPDTPSTLHSNHSLDICYIDDWLLVVNKPAGMVTHPTYLHDQGSLTSLLADFPLHPVNRLDRDTSGLVLIARNGHAHYVIARNPMRKIYVGLVHGQTGDRGTIDAPIWSDGSIILREVHDEGSCPNTLAPYPLLLHSRISLFKIRVVDRPDASNPRPLSLCRFSFGR